MGVCHVWQGECRGGSARRRAGARLEGQVIAEGTGRALTTSVSSCPFPTCHHLLAHPPRQVYKFDEDTAERVTAYASFGGLLMALSGSYRHVSGVTVGEYVYLLIRR